MSWQSLDWLKVEADEFIDELKSPITGIYWRMAEEFRDAQDRRTTELRKSVTADNVSLLDWSDDLKRRQEQLLTAMVLTVTYRSVEDLLTRLSRYFIPRHAPELQIRNRDLSKLEILRLKYQHIDVPLTAQREFALLKQLQLARNCCVHNQNVPPDEYLEQFPKSNWLNDAGNITITEKRWEELVERLTIWASDLVFRLHVRWDKHPTAQAEEVQPNDERG
jgi:hypothetical protein